MENNNKQRKNLGLRQLKNTLQKVTIFIPSHSQDCYLYLFHTNNICEYDKPSEFLY